MGHSLTAAVSDGTISEEAAFCGLSPASVIALQRNHPGAQVLVRFRGRQGDGRKVMFASDLVDNGSQFICDGNSFGYCDIRDVMAVAG